MSKRTTESMGKSSPEWDELEDWLRGSMQNLIQQVLEEEVTEFSAGRSQRADLRRTAIAVTGTDTADRHQRRLPPDHVYTHIDVTSMQPIHKSYN